MCPNRGSSADDIAAHVGITKDTVYAWIADKAMPAHRVSRLWKFQVSEIDEWVRSGGAAQPLVTGRKTALDRGSAAASAVGGSTYPDQPANFQRGCRVNSSSAREPRYALNFVSRALLTREAVLLAEMRQPGETWESVRDRAVSENVVQARAYRSGVRLTREAVRRLVVLSEDEVEFLLDAASRERAYLMWAAACRAYSFIGDFAVQVLRERFLILAPKVMPEDLEGFVSNQAIWHPELAGLSDSMKTSIRRTVFRMMREADLMTSNGDIVPALFSEQLVHLLMAPGQNDLKFFPTTQGGAR